MNTKERIVNICFIVAAIVMALLVVKMLWGQEVVIKKVPIRQRIEFRITEEIGTDTAIKRMLEENIETDTSIREKKQRIIEEEIQNNVVKIPIVKIEVIKLDILKIAVCPIEEIPMQVISILSYSPQELALAFQKLTPTEIKVLKGRIVSPDVLKTIVAKIKGQEINKLAALVYDVSYSARKFRGKVNRRIASNNFKKYLREGNISMLQNCLQTAKVDDRMIDTLITGLGKEVPKLTIQGFGEYVWKDNAYIVEDYDREVKQNDLAIFDITEWSNIIKAMEFVAKNKDKLDAVIVGWSSGGENNFDNLDFSTYPEIMRNYEYFFSTCKAIRPDLPVGLCVTLRENTMYQWLKSCSFKFDFLSVYNVTKMGANFEKIQKRFPNQKLMVGGMNAGENAKGGTAYKNYIEKIKNLGYVGSIWFE